MALTKNTNRRTVYGPQARKIAPAAGQTIYMGSIVVVDSTTGLLQSGTGAAATDYVVGVAMQASTDAIVADGQAKVGVESGIFEVDIEAGAGNTFGKEMIGKTVYLADDSTVSKSDASGARPAAGILFDIEGSKALVIVGGVAHHGA